MVAVMEGSVVRAEQKEIVSQGRAQGLLLMNAEGKATDSHRAESERKNFFAPFFNSFVKNPVEYSRMEVRRAALMLVCPLCTFCEAARAGWASFWKGGPAKAASNQMGRKGYPKTEGEFCMSGVKWLIAFSIGAAAGAAVALIYAPQSGARTRRQIRRGLEDAGDYIKETAETVGGHAEKYVKRGKDVVEMVADTATSAYGAARKVVPI